MTVSSTNISLIVLTDHVPYTNGAVAANAITYFGFDVPAGTGFDTNRLLNGSTNLNLLFNQTALPAGNQLGDYTLLAGVTSGAYVLTNNTPPPSLLPGARYFLGVQNPNNTPATFALQVDTQVLTNTTAIALTNAIAYTNTSGAAPQYIPLPCRPTPSSPPSKSSTRPANWTSTPGTPCPCPAPPCLITRPPMPGPTTKPSSSPPTSFPVPLTPGTWYLAVSNLNPDNPLHLPRKSATYIPQRRHHHHPAD